MEGRDGCPSGWLLLLLLGCSCKAEGTTQAWEGGLAEGLRAVWGLAGAGEWEWGWGLGLGLGQAPPQPWGLQA